MYNDAFNGKKTTESVVHEFNSSDFNSKLYVLACNMKGEPVAFISAKLVGEVGQIPTLAVRRDAQSQGIGTYLLLEIIDRLQMAGAKEVILSVSSTNTKAINLYEKNGFTPYAKRSYYFKKISAND
ncbi:GNAT family N-acetyltransferase [Paenibacillus sp. HWE-109]|uniref:GNAT family N-acetyltransferase n=1 Tax=Paenibacillus sp. HWE-109 TaxID=1306526 RepID=UPI0024B5FEE7|nr:GNAT family N-acetyltransferase [Paenibacillus sp. HWE-109]